MVLLKNLITNIIIIIIFISINCSDNNCSYNNIEDYFNSTDTNELKNRCFSLSYNFGNGKCCYNTANNECIYEQNSNQDNDDSTTSSESADIRNLDEDEIKCPNEILVPNNCGMAGIFQPFSDKICKEISLVQGYCCYSKIKNNNSYSIYCIWSPM